MRYSMPHGGGQLPIAYEITSPEAVCSDSAAAIATAPALATTATSHASAPRRIRIISGAAMSGSTTCRMGRCALITRESR
jgi:hypothetical protein